MFVVHSSATHAEVEAMPLASVAAATMRGATSTILGGSASSMAIFARSGSSAHPGAPDRKSSSARSSAVVSDMVLVFIGYLCLLRFVCCWSGTPALTDVVDVDECWRQAPLLFHELS